ncbi:MAG: gliding motility-associated C-terminal domain-containing protein [Vicingaceae bacterium]
MLFFNKKIALKVLLLVVFFNVTKANAQCFEIESILVDACGSPEWENEMVRFKVGSTALNSANISANWPTAVNSWDGICQNGTTSSTISALNSSIIGCGLLVEPTAGVLPANATVIFFTSTAVDVTANSFANLNDTLFAIFQCTGNMQGHFSNGSGTGTRTLTISFSSPVCSDNVTYDKGPLDNSNGASVSFDPAGNPTYYNNGCQAPFNPIDISGDIFANSSLTICAGDSINLFANTVGAVQSIIWSGGDGIFSNSTSDTTTYQSSLLDNATLQLYVGGITACNDTIFDTLNVSISSPTNVSILNGDTAFICNGASLTLNGTGTSNYLWSTGATTNSINVTTQGYYFLTDTSSFCSADTAFIQVNTSPSLSITLSETGPINLCQGDSITLHANGANNYLWNTAANTDSITVNNAGTYFVYGNDGCPSDTATIVVNTVLPIALNITQGDTASICNGASLTLNGSGTSNYLWSTGATTSTINITTQGYYFLTDTSNLCPADTAFIQVNTNPSLNITLSETGPINLCQGDNITLHANGADNYLWNTSANTDSITVNNAGTYFVYGNDVCPTDTATIVINTVLPTILNIDEGNSASLCAGNTFTIHTTSNANNFNWNNGSNLDSLTINTTGLYWVTASNGTCPPVTDTINITLETAASALILGDTNLCIGSSIILNASGNGSFSWSNGTVGNATTINLTQTITLTATNLCGNIATYSQIITEEDCNLESELIIPNVFTPNNDQFNDVFKIKANNFTLLNGKVYNRWGLLLYEWNDIDKGWDGKNASEGTYFYIITTKDINDKTEEFKGSVLLLK